MHQAKICTKLIRRIKDVFQSKLSIDLFERYYLTNNSHKNSFIVNFFARYSL